VPIYTVLGPIDPDELGRTSMHEHLLLDARVWMTPSPEPPPNDGLVTPENLTYARWNYLNFADNLVSEDPDVLVGELARAQRGNILAVLEQRIGLVDLLRRKHRHAAMTGEIFLPVDRILRGGS
jgi:phosphotriesterase-related protein